MCSLHLTHPSGAVGSRHCGARGAVWGSVPCSRVSPQSCTLPARAGIRTHDLGLPRVSSPMLHPLGYDCPKTSWGFGALLKGLNSVLVLKVEESAGYSLQNQNGLIIETV